MLKIRNQIGGVGNLLFKQAYILGQVIDGVIPDVYVQSEDYWKKHKVAIKSIFHEGIGFIDRVGLQIRRGDYLNTNIYTDLSRTDYYQKALEMFPDERFLVFCHDGQNPEQDKADKEWCVEFLNKLIPGRFEINESTEETEDLNKLASCKAKIIANSTFGWWAGYLGEGKVICPKVWFTDGVQRCALPEEFIKL